MANDLHLCIPLDMEIEATLRRDTAIDMRYVMHIILFCLGCSEKLIFEARGLNCFVLQVNPEIVGRLEKAGLSFTGKDLTGRRMEVRTFTHRSNVV